jgi:hypothetical protein
VIDIFPIQNFLIINREVIGSISFFAIGLAICGVFHLLFSEGFIWLKKFFKNFFSRKYKSLESLTPVECSYLSYYIDGQTQTVYFSSFDGVVKGLEAKGIIYLIARRGLDDHEAYNIQPWAYERLSRNPRLLYEKLQMLERYNSRPIRKKFRSPDQMKWS